MTALAEAAPTEAEFLPIWEMAATYGYTIEEVEAMTVIVATRLLGCHEPDGEPIMKGARMIQLPSDSRKPGEAPGPSRRRRRPSKVTGKRPGFYRGAEAR